MTDSNTFTNAPEVIALLEQAAEAMRNSAYRHHSVIQLPAHGRLLVTGDLHDNPIHLTKIQRLARLDEDENNHVIVHEMIHSERLINGVDLSYRMICRVAEWVIQYPDQVHPLLANHELSQLTGHGVSKGAGNSVELFEDGLAMVFGNGGEDVAEAIRTFIRAMVLALKSDSGLLCAHSLPATRSMKNFDPTILDRDLTEEAYQPRTGSAYLMVWGRAYGTEHVETLAKKWNVKLFCLGHEHAETGIDVRGEKVVILNSDHERGAVLPIDLTALPTAEEAVMSAVPLQAVGEDG